MAKSTPGRKRVVYVAGPLSSSGDWQVNIRAAVDAAEELAAAGFVPLVPHLMSTWHLLYPHDHAFWMQLDLALLERCDAVLRLPGDSVGADMETAHAEENGIPWYRSPHVLANEMGRAAERVVDAPTRPRGLQVLDALANMAVRLSRLERNNEGG